MSTKIEWVKIPNADGTFKIPETWNPVTGCTKVSQGCKNCYAETFYERFHGKHSFRNVTCHPDRLQKPYKWTEPCGIFVNSMSDLFHEDVPFEFIDEVYSVMQDNPRHTFLILTKRPKRALEFYRWAIQEQAGVGMWEVAPHPTNIILGVSVEDQDTARERIPVLMKIPCYYKFLSCEPLLGPLDITNAAMNDAYSIPTSWVLGHGIEWTDPGPEFIGVHWVIVGGESGPGARPMHPDWARSLRDQCVKAKTPFFFKQWGNHGYYGHGNYPGDMLDVHPQFKDLLRKHHSKKAAGRLLDNNLWAEFPEMKVHSSKPVKA